jgi:hypothetical protein
LVPTYFTVVTVVIKTRGRASHLARE